MIVSMLVFHSAISTCYKHKVLTEKRLVVQSLSSMDFVGLGFEMRQPWMNFPEFVVGKGDQR